MLTVARLGTRVAVAILVIHGSLIAHSEAFRFRPYLDPLNTLHTGVLRIEDNTVTICGIDSARPAQPFTFQWGDGVTSDSWLPATHAYSDSSKNYIVAVTAHYSPAESRTSEVQVRFLPTDWSFVPDPSVPLRFKIPSMQVEFTSTQPGYRPPDGTKVFTPGELEREKRDAICYVMSVAQHLQLRYLGQNATGPALGPHEMLKDSAIGGCYSLWYADPPAMLCAPSYIESIVGFSSFFHEMGHNVTLNSPAAFRMGGKIDGDANAIFAEALAGLFQHATVFEILNTEGHYGLSRDIVNMIEKSGIQSAQLATQSYRELTTGLFKVTTINDPATPNDETLGTFGSVVYVFMDLADARVDFRGPLTRAMALFQTFNQDDVNAYQVRKNDSFRLTFWIAALSYGFDADLRGRFRDIGFPVNDDLYEELLARVDRK